MFGSEVGSQVGWLIPAALVLGVAGLWFARGRGGLAVRAGLTLWLGWLLVTCLTFSFMAGIFHPYYTVALAPAIGALVGIGGLVLWRHRDSLVATGILGSVTALTAALSDELLARDASWHPWLRYAVLVVGFVAAALIVGVHHLPRRAAAAVAGAAAGRRPGRPGGVRRRDRGHRALRLDPERGSVVGQRVRAGRRPARAAAAPGRAWRLRRAPTRGATGGASTGGLLDGSTSSAELTTLLETDASSYTWVAAAIGSNNAAGYQLATQQPVMAIGGFNGSDPSPTLAQFQQWVSQRKIHFFIAQGGGFGAGGGGGPNAGGGTSSQIASWVESTFSAKTVDGVTVYDLTVG